MKISKSRKTLKGRIFLLQFIFALILDKRETKTVWIFFFLNSLFQGYQSFQKIDNESSSDQSNLELKEEMLYSLVYFEVGV